MNQVHDYKGMTLHLAEADEVNRSYFAHCARHDFHLQACAACRLLHYPPSNGCPWCGGTEQVWTPVAGSGTVYSYHEVVQAIQPGFAPDTPYLVLLVELDSQRGVPTAHEALRVFGNLVDAGGRMAAPEQVRQVGIGSRVRMVFTDLGDGMSIPQWTLDEGVAQPVPWRYPE
jgi:uncharacterized protein